MSIKENEARIVELAEQLEAILYKHTPGLKNDQAISEIHSVCREIRDKTPRVDILLKVSSLENRVKELYSPRKHQKYADDHQSGAQRLLSICLQNPSGIKRLALMRSALERFNKQD